MNGTKVKRASFSLEDEYQDLFRQIAKKTRRSMTDELRLMIDTRALALGLKPVGEVAVDEVLEDLYDAQRAREVLEAIRSGKMKTIPLEQLKAEMRAEGLLDD